MTADEHARAPRLRGRHHHRRPQGLHGPVRARISATSSTPRPTSSTMCSTASSSILERDGDVYCPCRMRTGDPKEDLKIICPCIPFYADQFAAMQKCWCGLFIRTDVEDGADLIGVIEEPEAGTLVDVPVARLDDAAAGQRAARQDRQARHRGRARGRRGVRALEPVPPRVRPAVRGIRRRLLARVPVARVALRRPRRARPTTPTPTSRRSR